MGSDEGEEEILCIEEALLEALLSSKKLFWKLFYLLRSCSGSSRSSSKF